MYELFTTRQKDLLALANTNASRFLLNLRSFDSIIRVTPNSIIYKGEGKQLNGTFISGENAVGIILLPLLTKLDIIRREFPKYTPGDKKEYLKLVEHLAGLTYKPQYPNVFLDSGTFSSDSGGTGGIFGRDAASYSTSRSAASATGSSNNVGNEFVGGNYDIFRWFCPTDFSTITAGSTVTTATGYIWPVSKTSTTDDTAKFIVTTQASNTTLATSDYSKITLNSPTTYGTTGNYSAMTTGQYNTVTMDAGFLTLVQSGAGGFIKLGMRATADINATTPTTASDIGMSVSANQRTKFDITWTLPVVGGETGYSFFM